jgi:hypothetical protein
MDFESVQHVIDMDSETGEIMAKVVISTYRGEPMALRDLDHFDSENFALALQVIGYRRNSKWSDNKFCALAQYAKARLAQVSA